MAACMLDGKKVETANVSQLASSSNTAVIISDDMADCCKTLCKICDLPFPLSGMRSHTLTKHDLQITRYKEIYGQFVVIEPRVYHKCYICDKVVLLDNDALGGHIKSIHKMKEKVYKERYMTYANLGKAKVPGISHLMEERGKKKRKIKIGKKSKDGESKISSRKVEYDFVNTFPDYEYSCNLKHCDLCEKDTVVVNIDRLEREVTYDHVDPGDSYTSREDEVKDKQKVEEPETEHVTQFVLNKNTSLMSVELVGGEYAESNISINEKISECDKDEVDQFLSSPPCADLCSPFSVRTDETMAGGRGKGDIRKLAANLLHNIDPKLEIDFSEESLLEDSMDSSMIETSGDSDEISSVEEDEFSDVKLVSDLSQDSDIKLVSDLSQDSDVKLVSELSQDIGDRSYSQVLDDLDGLF